MTDEEKKAIDVIKKRTERLMEELKIEKEDFTDEPKIAYLMQEIEANKRVLNLIQKQDIEINKLNNVIDRIKEYTHQEIACREEDIEDYIDDDKEGNKNYIGELKEEKQHWKDIERIIEGKNNEELYMNWWKFGLYE